MNGEEGWLGGMLRPQDRVPGCGRRGRSRGSRVMLGPVLVIWLRGHVKGGGKEEAHAWGKGE